MNGFLDFRWPAVVWRGRQAAAVAACLACAVGLWAQAEGVGPYTVLLDSPSVGERMSALRVRSGKAARARFAAMPPTAMQREVARSQQPVIAAIEGRGAHLVGSVRNVLNAVFVRATPQQAEQIARLPGVRSIVPSRRLTLARGSGGNAPSIRQSSLRPEGLNATGEGVRIAIIDTGLDFDHPAFRDESLPLVPGYPRGRPEDQRFASRKVLAARSYVRMLNSGDPDTSSPDDLTPRDFDGHGTAAAMIAAGRRVDSPGGAVEGVAPRAYLGIYKVFGSPAINPGALDEAVIAAIDDAVVDGMDILNLSLGSVSIHPWHSSGSDCGLSRDALDCNPLAIAAQSAAFDYGRVVVAAAGNDGWSGEGPLLNTVDTPAIAPDVIAVAATPSTSRFVESLRVGGRAFAALSGSGPAVREALTAPAVAASRLGDLSACHPFPRESLAGQILVAERGDCWFVDKVENADQAGALGVVIFDNEESGDLTRMSALQTTDVPAFFVSSSAGAHLLRLLEEVPPGSRVSVTLDATLSPLPVDGDGVSTFSSRGPTPGLYLKPDIAAPGEWVFTASSRQGADQAWKPGFGEVEGTSFAAPAVAGAAALVWEANPDFDSLDVASALINTAREVLGADGEQVRLTSAGAGLVHLEGALDPGATVFPPTVSFGRFEPRDLPVWHDLQITNWGSTTEMYRLTVEQGDPDRAAGVTLDGFSEATFRLAPDEYRSVRVRLDGNFPDPGSYEGHLRLSTESGRRPLRIPYLYVVGSGEPAAFVVLGRQEFRGVMDEPATRTLTVKFIDRFGVPVASLPVELRTPSAGVRIVSPPGQTDAYGLAEATVEFANSQEVVLAGGGLEIPFSYVADARRVRISTVADTASLEAGIPVAPGSMVTVFGSGLAEFEGEAPLADLPLSLKGTSASFDYPELGLSVAAPLYRVGPDQVGLQVPWEFAGLNFAWLKIRFRDPSGDSRESNVLTVDLEDVAPGIFLLHDDAGDAMPSVVHADGSPVSRQFPALRGSTVTVYMTGNGPLTRPLPTGTAPTQRITTLHQPQVAVGGTPAKVSYSGVTPNTVGLYQVDFVVPEGMPAGRGELEVVIHGVRSNTILLPVR